MHRALLLLVITSTFVACSSPTETNSGVGSGAGGSTTTSTTATSTTGTGGSGGGGTCPAPAMGQLALKAVYTTTYDSTNEQISESFGDPNTSTLSASLDDMGTLSILAKDSAWDLDIEVHLEPNVSFPITVSPSSYPNYVTGAAFSRGAGLANNFSQDDNFVVTLQSGGCRVKGSYSGGMSSQDGGLELLTVKPSSFDVPVTAP